MAVRPDQVLTLPSLNTLKQKNMEHRMRLIIELISVGAIVASLIFLGIEAKQSNQLAKATIRQALNETDMEIYRVQMDEEIIPYALYKNDNNLPLDGYEQYNVNLYNMFNFRDFDNSFYQYRIGLFEQSDWLAYRRIIKSLLHDPTVLKMWDNQSHVFSKEFKLEVELILEEIRPLPVK
ncbi:MAG: hypothetical protein ACKVJ9_07730 [Cytophagales bacterium]|jgi:hypothetical protein|tara:strand:+ start:2830 stop:3366 length:537 start_codon:yes stop_codon:yes gene_type:complete